VVLTLGSPPEKGGKKKYPGINPGQPARKGRGKKKTPLVLTLGRSGAYTANPPDKGEKKKNKKTLGLTLGSPLEKGGEKKKKNPGINPGQVWRLHSEPAGKGRKKKKRKKDLVLSVHRGPEIKIDT
jgi:hypothetical protein